MPTEAELDVQIAEESSKIAAKKKKKEEELGRPLSLIETFALNNEFNEEIQKTVKAINTDTKIGFSQKVSLQTHINTEGNKKIIAILGANLSPLQLSTFDAQMKGTEAQKKALADIEEEFTKTYDEKVAPKIDSLLDKYNPISDCPLKELIELYKFAYDGALGENDDKYKVQGETKRSSSQVMAEAFCKAKLQMDLGSSFSADLCTLYSRHPEARATIESLYKEYPNELETQLKEVNQYFTGMISSQLATLKAQYPDGKFPIADIMQFNGQVRTGLINAQKDQVNGVRTLSSDKANKERNELINLIELLAIGEVQKRLGIYIDVTPYNEAKQCEKNYDPSKHQESLKLRKEGHDKLDKALKAIKAALPQDNPDSARLTQEAEEYIAQEKIKFDQALYLKDKEFVASELSKASLKQQKGKAIPPKHSDAITKLLASPASRDFVERYKSDEEFRKTVDARMQKSDDISDDAAQLKYLKTMIETPDLFQRIYADVERANRKAPKEIDTRFVKQFNTVYDDRVEPFMEAVKSQYLTNQKTNQKRGFFSGLKPAETEMIESYMQPIIKEADKLGISLAAIKLAAPEIISGMVKAIEDKDEKQTQKMLTDLRGKADNIRNFLKVNRMLGTHKAFSNITLEERLAFYTKVIEPRLTRGKLLGKGLYEKEEHITENLLNKINGFVSFQKDVTPKFLQSDNFKEKLDRYMATGELEPQIKAGGQDKKQHKEEAAKVGRAMAQHVVPKHEAVKKPHITPVNNNPDKPDKPDLAHWGLE